MKIQIKDNEISFSFPATQKRISVYDVDADLGTHNTFAGMVDKFNNCGFCYVICMAYAGKPDQYSSIVIEWDKSEEEFRAECKRLGLNIVEI